MLQSDFLVMKKDQTKRWNHFLEIVDYKMNYCTKVMCAQNSLSSKFKYNTSILIMISHVFIINFYILTNNVNE